MSSPLPAPKIKEEGISKIKSLIDGAIKDRKKGIPGLVISIVNSKGDRLLDYANGLTSVETGEPMTTDTIFWVGSCTKFITTVACLQLVERGLIDLDDSDQLEEIVPELKTLPIVSLDGKGGIHLRPKKRKISLRMLLNHTSGLGYSFWYEELAIYAKYFNVNDLDPKDVQQLLLPLLCEPGTDWKYGAGLDIAGIALERITGLTIEEYLKKNIFEPLDMKDSTFIPNSDLLKNYAKLNLRDSETGFLREYPHIYQRVIKQTYNDGYFFQAGGGGLFIKPKEYTKFLSAIINDGVSPITKKRIIKSETVGLIYENQVPNFPDYGRVPRVSFNKHLLNSSQHLVRQAGDPPQGWGLSYFKPLVPMGTGRSIDSGNWGGLSNQFYWFDRKNGLALMLASNVLPFTDKKVTSLFFKIEKVVFDHLYRPRSIKL
ncbi:hypothetical protein WICMUC_000618 [Wickerhamomyces mucosus]|uniref:Beta-lactamase-related domain-containing protein n=1 Tax=Wickerhamomyces mucosus TaxID=1378264 RepID=A0A9P8PYH2_9ASCO|nr:hypothetical protein WICMUC_000618 [Wickerhamomyces mucosus]